MSPFAIITLFIFTLAAAIIIPILPSSRRVRIILAVIAVPSMILINIKVNDVVQRRSAALSGEQIDYFIDRSQQLLKQGKTQVLMDAYLDYHEHYFTNIPKADGAAYRARLLYEIMYEKNSLYDYEITNKLGGKP